MSSDNLMETGDWCVDTFLNLEVVNEAYEKFWTKKQLGIDADGKVYRTELDRKRPKYNDFSDHNWMFKTAVKIKVDNEDELI